MNRLVISPHFRTVDGISVRFAESERRDQDALLLSPWPESLYAFEATWSSLAGHAHLVAIDLPGFGRSERREELTSPQAMGDFLVRVADAFGLENPHVVGPDVGTAASLFAAARHPGRFRSLVVGTGATAVPIAVGEPLKAWIEAPDLEAYRRIEGRQVVSAAMGTMELYKPSDVALQDYLFSYEGEGFAESMRYVRRYPIELPVLRDLLPTIETPVQIISGRRDTVVPTVNADFLHERLPVSKLDLIDTKHWAWEDTADEYAAIVTGWWDGGYANPALREKYASQVA
jgi:pimeloyl-ACP methyl ester carboxylesterase